MIKKHIFLFLLIPFVIFAKDEHLIPGRIGSQSVFTARFGETKMFFYMNEEKLDLAQNFIQEVNEKMAHTVTKAELDCIVNEITPVATTELDPIGYDSYNYPLYADQEGSEIFGHHAEQVKKIAEKCLNLEILARSEQMSLIMNYDANKFHQDQCPLQYSYLKQHPHPIPRYTIFQDLTLINWEMGDKTFSGTILEDAQSEDSFILFFKNDEIVCNVYTEPAIYLGPYEAPEYPGAATLSPHSPIPSLDIYADSSVGSPKGKRISVAVRGLVRTEEIDELEKNSIVLPVDRPTVLTHTMGGKEYLYPNGMILREEAIPLGDFRMNQIQKLPDHEQVEIYASTSTQHADLIRITLDRFGINADINEVEVRHLIKRGSGFSNIKLADLFLGKNEYTLYIINKSIIPKNYRHYPISETIGHRNLPWIQLYHFPQNRIMKIDGNLFETLSLLPIDEILFRDGIFDIESSDPNEVFEKFSTVLHILAVPINNKSEERLYDTR